MLFSGIDWEPAVVQLASPYRDETSFKFYDDIREHINERYTYQATFDWFNDSVRLCVKDDVQYVVIHSLIQHVPASMHDGIKNHRVSSMTGNGGVWYGSVLVLRMVNNIVTRWGNACEDIVAVTKELERYGFTLQL